MAQHDPQMLYPAIASARKGLAAALEHKQLTGTLVEIADGRCSCWWHRPAASGAPEGVAAADADGADGGDGTEAAAAASGETALPKKEPVVFEFHGGGFAMGDA